MGSFRPTNIRYLTASEDVDIVPDSPGGVVLPFYGLTALNVGDIVFGSDGTDFNVEKSGTEADYDSIVGVVVGGKSTNYEVVQDDQDVGNEACGAGEVVLVGILGKFKVVAGASINVGAPLTVDATSGRVATGTLTTASADGDNGRLLGFAMEGASDGDIILAFVNPK